MRPGPAVRPYGPDDRNLTALGSYQRRDLLELELELPGSIG